MKRFFVTFAAVISAQVFLIFLGFLVLLTFVGVAMVGGAGKEPPIETGSYLVQSLSGEIPEFVPEGSLPIPRQPMSHTTVLENLEKARVDERIAGVVLKIEMPAIGWGKLAEIRDRIGELRKAGKPVFAFSTFAANKALALGAACDSFYVHPGGYLYLSGFSSERYYVKNMLDELGIEPQVSQIKEYKAMAEMVLREDMSPEVRENVTGVLAELYDGFLNTLAADRGVTRTQVDLWTEIAQFDPPAAIEHGLADGALFWEDLAARLGGGNLDEGLVSGEDYAAVKRASLDLKGDHIAVVHGAGNITAGESGWVFPMGVTMGDETMVAALQAALDNDRVKGVLLRLDTGGGLSTASDRIGEMVRRVAAEKPVVVSMVDMTASGGYMVSYRVKPLVANAGAIVGSIGSISMMGDMTGLANKLGITIDRATVGPHATLLSAFEPMSKEEFSRFEMIHWRHYNDWVAGIAEHRGMTLDEVDRLARGRIYTGEQAVGNGLIDATGGFDQALAMLREQVGLEADAPVTYVHLPRQKDIWQRLAEGELMALADLARGESPAGPSQERMWTDTLRFWQRCLSGEESLAMCWWRF